MTKLEAIDQIQSSLAKLTAEQLQALAELAVAWTSHPSPEDDTTRTAIAAGFAEADRGEFVKADAVDSLPRSPWQ